MLCRGGVMHLNVVTIALGSESQRLLRYKHRLSRDPAVGTMALLGGLFKLFWTCRHVEAY